MDNRIAERSLERQMLHLKVIETEIKRKQETLEKRLQYEIGNSRVLISGKNMTN